MRSNKDSFKELLDALDASVDMTPLRLFASLPPEPDHWKYQRYASTLNRGTKLTTTTHEFYHSCPSDLRRMADIIEYMEDEGWTYDYIDAEKWDLVFTREVPLTEEEIGEMQDWISAHPEAKDSPTQKIRFHRATPFNVTRGD